MVELAALKVKLAPVLSMVDAPPERVKVPEPKFMVLTPAPLLVKLRDSVIEGLLALKSRVPVNNPQTMEVSVAPFIVESTVTVPPPDAASNVAVSAEPGTLAPPAPPVVADQCVVVVESHVPAPPTQNRLAIS
jgi:hypothetical protein